MVASITLMVAPGPKGRRPCKYFLFDWNLAVKKVSFWYKLHTEYIYTIPIMRI